MSQTADNRRNDGGGNGGGISFPAVMASFRRQIIPMLIIFIILASIGWVISGKMKRSYKAGGTIMVTLGDEYVYNPLTGQGNSASLVTTPDSITLNEIGILHSPQLMEQVINELGTQRLFPKDAEKLSSPDRFVKLTARNDILQKFESAFGVAAVPKSSIINLNFKHEDPDIAVETLNTLIGTYLAYRRTLFDEGASDQIAQQRETTEKQLGKVDGAVDAFLKRNGLADFESERDGVRKRTEDLRAQLNSTRSAMREAEASLMATEDQLRTIPQTIDLFNEDRVQARLSQAELERQQLLAKYLPGSTPVREKELEIAQIRQLQNTSGGNAQGGRRTGPNTVYQGLQTERAKHQAVADSLREKDIVLVAQLSAAENKLGRMSSLSPTYQNLLREKKTLEARLEILNAREQEALVRKSTAEARFDNVKVINDATLARKGRNMKKIFRVVSIAGAALTALMIGLLRVFLDPKIYTGGGQRGTRGDGGRRASDAEVTPATPYIPEPVKPYQPSPQYYPDTPYAPAAAYDGGGGQDTVQDGYAVPYSGSTDQNAAYYEQPYFEQSYAEPQQLTGTDGYSAPYAEQSAEMGNPYATALHGQSAPQPVPLPPHTGEHYVQAPDGHQVPVIGQTPYKR
ncbi:GumC family protein [Robiginitomaculum antarcticum]|uniref:GumC family protein n=1 Tax=Robiginitomaculum antarcticum TaxID=437507 RepID=UPI000475C0F2|nr:hypothetical protein [Robiginitomaculum antarcticum]